MDLQKRFKREMVLLGLPGEMAESISVELSPKIKEAINNSKEGENMLLGVVSLANIQTRINANFPKITKNDYGLYTVATKVIQQNPSWTEDQVYTEVAKSFQPAASGGLLVIPQNLIKQRQQQAVVIGVAVVGIVALAMLIKNPSTKSE
jgi:hypothetical protein